jgi:hypothetical protein
MNGPEFVKYLSTHKGEAMIGNDETLAVARYMESKGLLTKIGTKDNHPIFRVTSDGRAFVTQALKAAGQTKGEKAKDFLKSAVGAFQDYAEAYRNMHPVGMEDVRRTFGGGGLGGRASDEPILLPPIEPMRLDVGQSALPKKGKQVEEVIKIDGQYYKKVGKNRYEKVSS